MSSLFEEYKEKGNTCFKEQDYTQASLYYQKAISNDLNNPIGYSNYAMSLIKLGKFKEAVEQCQIGLSHNPSEKIKTKLLWRLKTASDSLPSTTTSSSVDIPIVEVDVLPAEFL